MVSKETLLRMMQEAAVEIRHVIGPHDPATIPADAVAAARAYELSRQLAANCVSERSYNIPNIPKFGRVVRMVELF